MKTDVAGCLDVKLTVIAKVPEPWLEALASLGTVEAEQTNGDWAIREVRTAAVLRDLAIRVLGYVGPPTADVTVGFVGADRIVSDGTMEIPDVSLAQAARVVGPPSKETLQAALRETLKEAANR